MNVQRNSLILQIMPGCVVGEIGKETGESLNKIASFEKMIRKKAAKLLKRMDAAGGDGTDDVK